MALYDPAVSGADPIEARPGFAALLDRIESNGVRTVLVEDASQFARDLVTQELGIFALIGRGVRVLTASGDDLTNTDDPFKVAMHQIAGLSPTSGSLAVGSGMVVRRSSCPGVSHAAPPERPPPPAHCG